MKREAQSDLLHQQIFSWYKEWHAVEQLYSNWAAKYSLSDTSMWVLLQVYRHEEPITQREICQNLNMPKQTVSCVLSAMEEKGILTRTRCTIDRRSCSIAFTEPGWQWADAMFGALCQAEKKAFDSLSERDRAAFTRINSLLTQRLREAMESSPNTVSFPEPAENRESQPETNDPDGGQ